MYKKNYFDRVLAVVAELSEISSEDILYGRKTDEVVDARWIIVKILHEQGYHTSKIAMLLNMTQRNVTYILTVFQDRLDGYDSIGSTALGMIMALNASLVIVCFWEYLWLPFFISFSWPHENVWHIF